MAAVQKKVMLSIPGQFYFEYIIEVFKIFPQKIQVVRSRLIGIGNKQFHPQQPVEYESQPGFFSIVSDVISFEDIGCLQFSVLYGFQVAG